jgi:hypothetical protein
MDLGFTGPKFTWTNRQEADSNVRVRLDRAVANGGFSRMFEDCSVENLITTSSDHYAILISLLSSARDIVQIPVQQGFRFEAMWLRAPDYREVLEKAWTEGSDGTRSLQSTWANLGCTAASLTDWSRATFGSVQKKIRQLEAKIRDIREMTPSEQNLEEE